MLAVHVAQSCGVEVHLLHFRTPFTTLTALAKASAASLGMPLEIIDADDLYLQLIVHPRFGRCEGAAPCLDCREYMFHCAADAMEYHGAQFVVTGDVLGQRRWGQRRRDLEAVAIHTRLSGRIERPLSALLLDPTYAQQQGWMDRSRLYDIQGKGRRRQLELAEQFGLKSVPAPLARCCQLAENKVARRVLHAIEHHTPLTNIRCELMAVAEQIPLNQWAEMTLSRNACEGDRLREVAKRYPDELLLLEPANFRGPLAVLSGTIEQTALTAAAASLRAGSNEAQHPAEFLVTRGVHTQRLLL